MFRPRVIPVLLLKELGLVKSVGFRAHRYIGDPINAVRIFNDLKADELVFLDIEASRQGRLISLDFVRTVGEEARMPFAVGGGIRAISDIGAVINAGAEKVVINTYAGQCPGFIREASDAFGETTIVVCIDVKKSFFKGRTTWVLGGTKSTGFTPVDFARLMEVNGAGELIIQSIDHDGRMGGYNIDLISSVSSAVNIPVVALGGAGSIEDLRAGYRRGGANGLAAGSLFVYQGKRRGVLINYPDKKDLVFE
ncbi:MAG TPA: AglZ/HisF2 family acetamidino modification protein [Pyrinomonadaceae bacterium]|nr:AglZ/HisF2 family acetamidino modification protein [Pyrinomonadaceae bacterium]